MRVPHATVRVDPGDRYSHVTILNPAGELLKETRLKVQPDVLRARCNVLARARVAIEVGTNLDSDDCRYTGWAPIGQSGRFTSESAPVGRGWWNRSGERSRRVEVLPGRPPIVNVREE